MTRKTNPRSSKVPHDPEPKADAEPTAGLPAQSPDGEELGAAGEETVEDLDREANSGAGDLRKWMKPGMPPDLADGSGRG